jgi:hydroxyethylthiazole kinase-like uncharacterized protein yjeF
VLGDRPRTGSSSRVTVLVGPGGNGGDGLVVSRLLAEAGVEVRTFVLQEGDRLSRAAGVMLERLHDAGEREILVASGAYDEVESAVVWADWVIDGLFGSGTTRPLAGRHRDVVQRLNRSGARVISLDLPSGVSSDQGGILGDAVRATVTLAMAFLKPAHLLFPASSLCGNVAVVSVDYPNEVLSGIRPRARVVEQAGVGHRLPGRRHDGHKGAFGRVLVVAGSVGMAGAAILCCRAALRAGAGLVTIAAPASLDVILEKTLPEAITIRLPDQDGHLASIDDARFAESLERADVLAIGPGLSRAPVTSAAVRELVSRSTGPILLDADGIAAFKDSVVELRSANAPVLMTPHPGEFGELVGRSPEEVDADRIDAAGGFAREFGLTLLLKGRPTAIGLPDGTVYLNPTGNTGLATGGSGDVLTGLIAGFVAGGATLEDAAILGAYVHGWAAEIYARNRAERSLTPSDLIELLPTVLREVESWS